ncbi:hypothetical protein ACFW1M_35385 [Streptomyces inhibens]|uniref:hypothetical protein n=1 Tax=Streptomyces inhibens TaxID=2293571 RepID=UPI0036CF2C08
MSTTAHVMAALLHPVLLHPVLLPPLLLAMLPKGAAAVAAARITHRTNHTNLADQRLCYLLCRHSTEQRTAARPGPAPWPRSCASGTPRSPPGSGLGTGRPPRGRCWSPPAP